VQASESNHFVKKKIGKIILIVVCGLVAYAVISAVVHSRREKELKQEIADIRRTLREQGFKTELDDFKITTDPAMRARVATLLALGYEPKLDTNDDRLDFRPVISNGTAKVIWKQDTLPLGTKTLQWADFRAALNKERQRIDAACEAALAGPIQSEMDPNNHVNPWNDHISYLHPLSATLGSRVLLELHDGNSDTAWTNLLAATRLVTAWKVEPAPISHILRSWMADETFSLTWQALKFSHWPDDKLTVLQNEWASTDFLTNLPETMGLKGAEDADLCQRLAQNPELGMWPLGDAVKKVFKSPRMAFQDAKDDLEIMNYSGPKALEDEKRLLVYYRNRKLDLQHAIQSPAWAQMRAMPGITNTTPFEYSSPFLTVLLTDHGRTMPLLATSAAVTEAQRRMLITAIALERYRGKYGSYPNSLAPLTPEILKAVPVDFMDGQPLRYRPTADGHFLLYSVGPDCIDDGGKQQSPDAPRFLTNNKGTYSVLTNVDIVWPPPAAP